MGQARYEVEFYEKRNGRCPPQDFLDSLSRTDVAFVEKALTRLEKYGHGLGRPYFGHLREKIWELRVNIQRGACRLLFFFYDGQKYVITHGFRKTSNKVRDSEIDKAIEYREDYFAREDKG